MDEIAFLLSVLAIVVALLALFTASSAHGRLRDVERRLKEATRSGGAAASIDVVAGLVQQRARPSVQSESEIESASERSGAPVLDTRAPQAAASDEAGQPTVAFEAEPGPALRQADEHPRAGDDPLPSAPARSLEERLGASLPIWFGAVALALAGVFLVKHFVEQGLLGPGPRIGIAVTFGFALLGFAFRIRAGRPAIAQGLAASGVAVLSGAVYAASALYGFLSPVMGTVAQGVVTGIAVGASMRFGPFVALLGLVGGFAIPALVGPGSIGAGTMFGYLTLLQVALAVVGRRQGWWWVPLLGAVGAFVWALVWPGLRTDGLSVVSAFAFVSAAVAVHASRGVRTRPGEGLPEVAVLVPWLAVGAALAVVLQDLSRTVFAAEHWGWIGAISVGSLVMASRDRALAALPWLAAVVVAVRLLLVADPALWNADGAIVATHVWAIVGYGLVFGLGGHLAASGRGAHRFVLAWLPPAALAIALFAAQRVELPVVWPALGAAVVAGGLALWTRVRAAEVDRAERESGLWSAVLFAIGFAFHQGVAPEWRAVALAGIPVGAAVLRLSLGLPRLASVSMWLSVGLGVVLVDDHAMSFAEAGFLFWNPPSLGALAVTASLLVTSRVLHRAVPGVFAAAAHQTAFVVAAAALLLVWDAQVFDHIEMAHDGFFVVSSLAVAWLGLGQALFRTAPRWAVVTRERPGSHLTAVGLVALVGFSGLLFNPLLMRHSVGSWPIVNGVLLAYGGGGLLALSAARSWRAVGAMRRANAAAAIVFVCGFVLVSLEVRQAYVGEVLAGPFPSRAELYTYSAVWLVYGAYLLALGVLRDLRSLRYASLLVVLAAVLKVFLLDASHLDGLLRVLSFFGLGVALIALAWVYQRFVVARE